MAETVSKAEFDALKAKLDKLEGLQLKTDEEKKSAAALAKLRGAQLATHAKAREAQGTDARVLKYVVGPSGAYNNGSILKPGEIATKPNLSPVSEPPADAPAADVEKYEAFQRSLPSIEWAALDKRAPKTEPPPEKRGPLTAAEMNKIDAERPKHGVQATKKGSRPSDTEV